MLAMTSAASRGQSSDANGGDRQWSQGDDDDDDDDLSDDLGDDDVVVHSLSYHDSTRHDVSLALCESTILDDHVVDPPVKTASARVVASSNQSFQRTTTSQSTTTTTNGSVTAFGSILQA